MDLTNTITMDPEDARQRADELEAHRKHLTPEEEAFLDGYRALASGRPIINLRETIAAGGCFDEGRGAGFPRLAVARSFDHWVYGRRDWFGRMSFETANVSWWLRFPEETLPRIPSPNWWPRLRAMVPPVPLGTRMRLGAPHRGGWRPCVTLFEVGEWAEAPRPPGDPALLRHIGGDLYVIEATWDLTDLERAVLAGARIA